MATVSKTSGGRSYTEVLVLMAINVLLVWYGGCAMSVVIEELPESGKSWSAVDYLASVRLALATIGLIGILKQSPTLMASAIVFFFMACFDVIAQVGKPFILLWNGGSVVCTEKLKQNHPDGCFWVDMAHLFSWGLLIDLLLAAAFIVNLERRDIVQSRLESSAVDNKKKKSSLGSVQDTMPSVCQPSAFPGRFGYGSPISN